MKITDFRKIFKKNSSIVFQHLKISGTVDNMIMLTNMYTHLQSNC
jgi:hypothetical protein